VDVHVADLHLAHLVLAQQICHTALSLALRETSKRRILKMPTQMSRVVDRMVVARQLAFSTSSFHIALLHTSAAWAQDTSSKPGLGFRRLVQGGQAAEGRQVLFHHGHLLLLPMAGQLSEVDKVGSFLRTGARFGKLREQVTTEEAVECEDGDAKAAADNGKEG